MAVFDAMTFIDKIKMRVNLDKMKRCLITKRTNAGDVHRMITAKDDRHATGTQNRPDTSLDIGMAPDRVGMHDVGIPDIDNSGFVSFKIGNIILMVIGAGVAKGKQG